MQPRPTVLRVNTSRSLRWSLSSIAVLLSLLFSSCDVEDVAVRECNDGDRVLVLCEDQERVVERHCDNERWVPETVDCSKITLPRHGCEEGQVETILCDDGQSVSERRCEQDEWVDGACEPISECEPDDSLTVACPNGKEQNHICIDRQWSPPIECTSQCLQDAIKEDTCGLNLRGDQTRACVNEQWAGDWVCHDPDECTDDDQSLAACQGWAGRTLNTCIDGQWVASTCQETELTGTVHDPDSAARGFCALNAAGDALCWASNSEGQVGVGQRSEAETVKTVTGEHHFTSIARGPNHGCAITDAGALYCWGSNAYGQIAQPSETSQLTPKKVPSLTDVQSVAAGPRNTCIIDSNQHLYCWGSNAHGQLADQDTPQTITPQRIADLEDVQQVAIGYGTICAVAGNEQLFCWGDNRASQVSNQPHDIEYAPVAIYNMDRVTHVAVASEHVCTIRQGDVYCWGYNDQGQIGDGSTNTAAFPVHIPLPHTAQHLDVGRRLTCAVTIEGELYCWGAGFWGEMGLDDPLTTYETPELVETVSNVSVVAISSGANDYLGHTLCIATRTGDVACWARNLEHSVPGTDIDSHTAQPVFITPE